MSRRPGYSPRCGGCFLVLFFGAFGGFGAAFLYALLFTPDNVSGSRAVGGIVAGIFFLIGLVGIFAGIRTLLGKPALGKTISHAGETNAYYRTLLPNAAQPALQPSGYYRLSPESSHRGQFLLLTFAALFWNGIISVFLVQKLSGSDGDDSPPWWFLSIFLLVGLGLIYGAIKSLLRWIMVGETHVDVNKHPVSPGDRLEVLVSQPGNYKIDQVKIDIVCEEKASYRQGTDTRTKTQIVREVPICELPAMTAREGKVLAHQTAQLPHDAMLSFKASNNEINWMIRVTMVLPGRPDVEQKYPLMVVSERLAGEALTETALR